MGPDDVSQDPGTIESQGGNSTGFNPAWNDVVQYIPEEQREAVYPTLSKWDQNFNEVQSKYKTWEQYDKAGLTQEEIDFALGVSNALANQPLELYNALDQHLRSEGLLGENSPQGQPGYSQGGQGTDPGSYDFGQGQEGSFDITQHPEFQRQQEAIQTMAQILQDQREKELEAEEDAAIEAELQEAQQSAGITLDEKSEKFVLAQMLEGATAEQAIQAYSEFLDHVRSEQRRAAPKVLGPGGSIPKQDIDPRKLANDRKGTRNLVAQYLQQVNAQAEG